MNEINDKVFQMRVSEDFLRRVDDWRRQQQDIPSRSDGIRRLVDQALSRWKPTEAPPANELEALARPFVTEGVDILREMAASGKTARDRQMAISALKKRGLKA